VKKGIMEQWNKYWKNGMMGKAWNSGIMDEWNHGRMKENFIFPIIQHSHVLLVIPIFHRSVISFFQSSNIPSFHRSMPS